MSKKINVQYIRDKIPVVYRYRQFMRWFMIIISFLMIVYSLYFLLNVVNAEAPVFYKIVPFVILFVGLDSVLRRITSLNSISFLEDHLRLGYIAKKTKIIPYDSIQSIDLLRKVTYYVLLSYRNEKGEVKQISTPASFPHTLEVLLNVADMAEHAVISEKMQGVLDYLKEIADEEIRSNN